ncbi:MAG: HNH endonuclease [Myxococcales bacterium]|nr:HNH endonuclease [Myxococcales bacterium]
MHHIKPRSEGGGHELWQLTSLCDGHHVLLQKACRDPRHGARPSGVRAPALDLSGTESVRRGRVTSVSARMGSVVIDSRRVERSQRGPRWTGGPECSQTSARGELASSPR